MGTRTRKPTLDELACQYLDSTISVDQSIQILQEMNNRFGAFASGQKLNEFRKIYALVGIKG